MASLTTNEPRLVLGPLTKTFTPNPSCSTALAQCETCTIAWQAQGCSGDTVFDTTDCWPPADAGAPTPTAPFGGRGFYSPGFDCPHGYTNVCSATAGGHTGWPVQFSMLPGETAVGCCPTGFACAFQFGQTCASYLNNYATAVVGTCSNGQTISVRDLTVPYSVTYETKTTGSQSSSSIAATTEIIQFQVLAPLIDIRWQSSDITTATSSVVTPVPSGNVSGAHSTGSTDDSGLSTGAKAGIGVGVAVGVLACLAGAIFLWRRGRTPKSEKLPDVNVRDDHELQGNPVYEMDNQRHYEEAANKDPPWYERHEVRGSEPQLPQLPG